VTAASASSIKVSWKKISGASGYKVYRATSSGGTYTKVCTAKSAGTVSYTDTGLTSGKKYYYKVRAYRTVSETKVYGEFSSVKSVKTK
jgi:fibronectin type 3 domain-containing protein